MKNLKKIKIWNWLLCLSLLAFIACDDEETVVGSRPVAEAGPDQNSATGARVILDGSASTDADGDPLTYSWALTTVPSGSAATVNNNDQAMASFIPDVAGTYVATLTVNDGNNADVSDDVTIEVEESTAEVVIIDQNISEDTVWEDIFADPSIPDYRVTRSISIDEAATLTIEPGVIVAVNSDLYIDVSGAIIADGESSNQITFTGSTETPGFWAGVFIFSNNTNNLFNYVNVQYAGGAPRGFGISSAAIGVNDGDRVKITNSTISESDGYGLFLERNAILDDFADNAFLNNTGAPLALDVNNIANLDAGSTFTGNGNQFVEVFGSILSQTSEVTWLAAAPNLPYRASGNISLESGVAISAGTVFEFASGLYLQTDASSTTTGYIKAIGTASDKIIFRGANDVPGFWIGIQIFTNDTNNQFDHVIVQNGGSSTRGFGLAASNVAINDGDQLSVSNSEFSNASGYGIFCERGSKLVSFVNSVCKNNTGLAAAVDINSAHVVDSQSQFNEGNGDNSLEITGTTLEQNTQEVTWNALSNSTPFLFSGNISIESGLVLSDGVKIEVGTDKFIETDGDGYITADAVNGISITGKTTNPGSWMGIQIFTNDTRNIFNNVTISHGGSSTRGFGLPKSNIAVNSGDRLQITNCTITDCDGTGLFGEAGSTVIASGNTYSNNVVDVEIN